MNYSRASKILKMCNNNVLGSPNDQNFSSNTSSPAPVLNNKLEGILTEVILDDDNVLNCSDPFEDNSGDDYVPISSSSDSDEDVPPTVRIDSVSKRHELANSDLHGGRKPDNKDEQTTVLNGLDTFEDESSDDYVPISTSSDSDEHVPPAVKIDAVNKKPEMDKSPSRGGRKPSNKEEQTKKRKRNSSKWVRNVRKLLKTEGKAYESISGKSTVPAKQMKAACVCKRKCFEKYNEECRQIIFNNYYKLSSSAQNQFIGAHVEEYEKKSQRLRRNNDKQSRRKFSRKYFLPKNSDLRLEICQTMFLNTLDLSIKRVRVIVEKKRSGEEDNIICSEDKRGKHGNQPKIPKNDKLIIKEHIHMFPATESHYSRSHTEKKYLSSDLSISKMYRLYVDYCTNEKNVTPQKESFYRKIFVEEFNISFKKPKNDTCGKCDKYQMQLKCCENEEERVSIEDEKNKHLNAAEMAYEEKRKDKAECQNNSGVVTLSFDLQKCLPTPYLRNGVSFYKRQLWTFNLTIYQTIEKKSSAICYLWNETIAGRGGQEIGSCIYHYLHDLAKNAKIHTVNMYSDSCGGQNRNIYFSTILLSIVYQLNAQGRVFTINHKFLESGHTHMEADTVHAAIEKTKKHTAADIELPRDWANLIRFVQRKSPIQVIELEQPHFLDVKSTLKTHFVHRKQNTLHEPLQWLQIKWMQYSTSNNTILYKHSFEEDFKSYDISRRRTRNLGVVNFKPLHKEPLPLTSEKLADLKSLLPFISNSNREYYNFFINNIKSDDNITDHSLDELEENE